jgi:hypothetical protein
MQEGIRWFLDHEEHSLWRLLDPQAESMPDQSLERPWDGGGAVSQKRRPDVETGAIVPFLAVQPGDGACQTCGKHRSEHPNWKFCGEGGAPGWARQRSTAPPQANPAGRGEGGKGKDKGKGKGKGKCPAWMQDHASQTPLSEGEGRRTGLQSAGVSTIRRGRLAMTTTSARRRTFARHIWRLVLCAVRHTGSASTLNGKLAPVGLQEGSQLGRLVRRAGRGWQCQRLVTNLTRPRLPAL